MIRVLFLIHDLGQGGAERVLVNLVNNMDKSKFDITVMTLFDHGENRAFLGEDVRYLTWIGKMIPANSYWMKLFSPSKLHKMIVKEKYDIEIAFLEGPSARVISGCENVNTKLISWIHIVQNSIDGLSKSFRNSYEAKNCYNRFDKIICVSNDVKMSIDTLLDNHNLTDVIHNSLDVEGIRKKSREDIETSLFKKDEINIVGVGKLLKSKGFDRLINIAHRLIQDGFPVHLYLLGEGRERDSLESQAKSMGIDENATFLGYQMNPYKYMAKADLFVCASYAEGFSTAAAEALILGVPVCTVEVAGMTELLGENNKYGIITSNDEDELYSGIKHIISDKHILKSYAEKAELRGDMFELKSAVNAVEKLLTGCVA